MTLILKIMEEAYLPIYKAHNTSPTPIAVIVLIQCTVNCTDLTALTVPVPIHPWSKNYKCLGKNSSNISATFCISVIILPYIFGCDINKGRGVSINAQDYLFTPPQPMHILPVANVSPKWPSQLPWTPRSHKEYQCLWESPLHCIPLHWDICTAHYAAFFIALCY